jgi:hypothetical protein
MPKTKFHENPPVGVAVFRADGQADMKKRAVAFRDCFAKVPKMSKDRRRVINGERNACSLKERTKEGINKECKYERIMEGR